MMDETYKLCYVDGSWAYFTTQDLDKQWGDDWNDAPYECNAEIPYAWNEKVYQKNPETEEYRYIPNPEPQWSIGMVAFDGNFDAPCDGYQWSSSPYSVQAINRKAIPWLRTSEYYSGAHVEIWAGTTYPDFVALIIQGGGMVYVQVTERDRRKLEAHEQTTT
jgi:hypothetical protein